MVIVLIVGLAALGILFVLVGLFAPAPLDPTRPTCCYGQSSMRPIVVTGVANVPTPRRFWSCPACGDIISHEFAELRNPRVVFPAMPAAQGAS
jgi:hypothetical protein